MSKSTLAFDDLIETLKSLKWLTVQTELGMAGGRSWNLVVSRGESVFTPFIGGRKIVNGYNLTLTTPGKNTPSDLSENLGVIDATVTADRRRGSSAQTTTFAEEGWIIDEDEGRESFSISTSINIYIHEVK